MPLVIGVPKEHRPFEFRVGLTPAGVSILASGGHTCYVEAGAGVGSGFADAEFERAGARLAYRPEEIFGRADVVLKVLRPTAEEVGWMRGEQTLMALLMLASADEERVRLMREKAITAVAYERVETEDGTLPVLYPLSQIGGRMTAQIAASFLQNNRGGTGILLGGITGVPPAEVVILGAGVVGMSAVRGFLGMGARVFLLDQDLERLQQATERFDGPITTMVSHDFNVARVCEFADVLVGAVQHVGHRAPIVVSREMVASMRGGSIVIDVSIDQGGCVETSRPTQHDQPTFVAEGVTHYCVPNIPGVVARTATHAFLNAAWPYIRLVVEKGVDAALEESAPLRRGTIIRHGVPVPA